MEFDIQVGRESSCGLVGGISSMEVLSLGIGGGVLVGVWVGMALGLSGVLVSGFRAALEAVLGVFWDSRSLTRMLVHVDDSRSFCSWASFCSFFFFWSSKMLADRSAVNEFIPSVFCCC